MTTPNRLISALTIVALLGSTAGCGNLAVPSPFEEARGWKIEPGDHVVIVTKSGEEVRGKVVSVDEAVIAVVGRRVPREEIDEMWLERENAAGPVLEVALFAAGVVSLCVAYMKWVARNDTLDP